MKLVVLDRDGVINMDSDAFVESAEEWIPIPGSLQAIARLNHAGRRVATASNQSGLGRGLLTPDDINAIHRLLHTRLAELGGLVDAIFFCPHRPEAQCDWLKPNPGLLLAIRDRFGVNPVDMVVIGDSLRDLESAWAVGATAILVLTGKGAGTLARYPDRLGLIPIYRDLAAATDSLLSG